MITRIGKMMQELEDEVYELEQTVKDLKSKLNAAEEKLKQYETKPGMFFDACAGEWVQRRD